MLEKADVPPAQARAIVRAIEIELTGAEGALATKHDLLSLRQDIHNDMAALQDKSGVPGNMSGLRREMSDLRRELTAEIRASASGVIRRMYTALVGQTALLLGFGYYFVTHVR